MDYNQENYEKRKILKESLKIVDVLAGMDADEIEDKELLEKLIKKAQELKKNRYFILK